MKAKAAGVTYLDPPLSERVAWLRSEYNFYERDKALLCARLEKLRPLVGSAVLGRWVASITLERWNEFVKDILETHYDAAYARSRKRVCSEVGTSVYTVQPESISEGEYSRMAATILQQLK